MKKILKRVIAFALCAAMLISAGSAGAAAATETDCNGKCDHSPVIILPGINHSPTYLYDDNDQPVMYGDTHIGSTLLILNEAALTNTAIFKAISCVLASLALQTNFNLDKIAYELVSEIFKYQRCDENGDHVENLKTQRWNYSLEKMKNR